MREYKTIKIRYRLLLVALLLGVAFHTTAQVNNTRLRSQLEPYFKQYSNPEIENNIRTILQRVMTSESQRSVELYLSEAFGMQPLTNQLVDEVYAQIKKQLPTPYNSFKLRIYCGIKELRTFVTAASTNQLSSDRIWQHDDYKGAPWVKNLSSPFDIRAGLKDRHLALWASHGFYYANGEHLWKTQRPHLYCSTEDLLTQSIAVPFLYPMLERAGAIVFTPRERDWQRNEVVVDNDFPTKNGTYQEQNGAKIWQSITPGFTSKHEVLTDFDDPHHEGTARMIDSQNTDEGISSTLWTPNITVPGNYAVYVCYPRTENAVSDARYVICHGNINTIVQVNQKMGGGTWVYVGNYDFTAKKPTENYIKLTNKCQSKGLVLADAIRLGGGMSHVVRADLNRTFIDQRVDSLGPDDVVYEFGTIIKPNGETALPNTGFQTVADSLLINNDSIVQIVKYDYTNELIGSSLPRHLEAARYTTQYMGLQRNQFGIKDGVYDYGDDINSRAISVNYMTEGSIYLPGDSGLNVPLEMCLALHSDAGYKSTMDYVGSLAIHTSDFEDGQLPGGLSRMTSRDLCDILLQQFSTDMKQTYGNWTRRQIFDRNYGETRIPRIPSAILEMFSHQNFADMKRALDPSCKFTMARSIYKSILRYVSLQHSKGALVIHPVIAPLPVHNFAAQVDASTKKIFLSWDPTFDSLEETANPKSYIVYTRRADNGWDNGTVVTSTSYSFCPKDDELYHFKVEAFNDGGLSMPSEVLCARISSQQTSPHILIMNGFQRLASPEAVCTTDSCGFDIDQDPGVPYMMSTEFCGRQTYFGWDGLGKETEKGLGISGTELEGQLVMGNTFDYPSQHAVDIMKAGDYNISSCSRGAIENEKVNISSVQLLDLIMGAQRNDGYSSHEYKTFSSKLINTLKAFTSKGGAVLTSGAYIGTDMSSHDEQAFTIQTLHYGSAGKSGWDANGEAHISGMGTEVTYSMKPNADHLSTAYVSVLAPDDKAFATLVYSHNRHCAAVAYKGNDYSCLSLGFPIEQIKEQDIRQSLMAGFLNFLLQK